MAAVYLDGLCLENFRAIGARAFIGPFQDVNFFIGPNNAGKSTVLYFLANYLHANQRGLDAWNRTFAPADARIGKGGSEIKFALGVSPKDFVSKINEFSNGAYRLQAERLRTALTKQCGLLWFEPDDTKRAPAFVCERDEMKRALTSGDWQGLWQVNTGRYGGALDDWIRGALERISTAMSPRFPPVHLIPAIREVSEKGEEFNDYSGRGLIDKLAELQNPPYDQRHLRVKFDQINAFLRTVTESESATIEIPHDRRYVLVHMDDKVLPLSSLGTGIHEVVMIASFCTLLEKCIVCVEEPEIHLHPLLQRRLIRYLRDTTTNQYFIATHSASVIDAVPASIFSVENVGGDTRVKLCVTPSERHEVCKALGYRASDLLQSNAIVWVEGPSDRIYLKHWIEATDPGLVEGVDYSIMFYGGRLLSHLSANDPEVDDFISLRKLNRNVAVVIDSDRSTAHTPINATKDRVSKELGDGFSWVTQGREIENYVPQALMEKALATLHPKFDHVVGSGRFDHRLHFIEQKTGKKVDQVDKVKIARLVASNSPDLSQFDLSKKIKELVAFIRQAGHGR